MSTIDISAFSQVQSKPSGNGRTSGDSDTGQGKFSDAFDGVAAKGSGGRSLSSNDEEARSASESAELSLHEKGQRKSAAQLLRDASQAGTEVRPGHADGALAETAGRKGTGKLEGHPGADAGDEASSRQEDTANADDLLAMLGDNTTVPEASAGVISGTPSEAAAELLQVVAVPAGGKAGATSEHSEQAGRRGVDTQLRTTATLAVGTAEDGASSAVATDGDADQIFRLIRADGKAKPVEIAISSNGETVDAKEQAGTPARIEAVTVLDSRRYLGLAQSGNAGAVTSAIAQDPSWAASLASVDNANDATGKVVNTLKIQLHPIDLGMVTATLRLQGEALVVDLKVETGKAYRNLSDDQDAIVKALRGHGFAVDQISVQLSSPSDRGGNAGQGDSQAQFSGQQQAREGGNGRQNGDQQRFSGTFASTEGLANEFSQADNVSGNGQRRGAGGVYL